MVYFKEFKNDNLDPVCLDDGNANDYEMKRNLLDKFKQMNQDNPEYVGRFIAQKMEEEEAKLLADKWKKDQFYL